MPTANRFVGLSPGHSRAYYLGRGALALYVRGLFRWRVEGLEHLPATGPCILYANHVHWLDIPIMAAVSRRPIRYMAKQELFRVPILGPFLRYVGTFPVQRGQADKRAVRQALAVLAQGDVLGMFPEGTRSRTGQMLKPEPGVAYLAYKSGAPVVPVAISSRYRWFGPIQVRIGRPIQVAEWLEQRPGSAELAAVAERLMQALSTLLDPV